MILPVIALGVAPRAISVYVESVKGNVEPEIIFHLNFTKNSPIAFYSENRLVIRVSSRNSHRFSLLINSLINF